MKTYHSRELIKKLKEDGWILDRVRGSHHQFKHPHKRGVVTVQHPLKNLPDFVLNSIFKQAHWNRKGEN